MKIKNSHKLFLLFLIISLSIVVSIYISVQLIVNETSKQESTSIYYNSKLRSLTKNRQQPCTMKTCFNFTKCLDKKNFSIYIYKEHVEKKKIISTIYQNILDILNTSIYITQNPHEACLFILQLDTLDRDKLSSNFVKNMDKLVQTLPHWNNGENHLIFNLYSGSWPNYAETLEMNTSKAILVKASFSAKTYRPGFDISFPLFHADLPFNNSNVTSAIDQNRFTTSKKYFLTFKVHIFEGKESDNFNIDFKI